MADRDEHMRVARAMFVENGKSLADIAIDLDISIFVLNAASRDEGWVKARDDLREQRRRDAETDTLSHHKVALRRNLNLVEYFTEQLQNKQLTPQELRDVRFNIAAMRDASEALHHIIGDDRTVSGVKKDAPSVQDPNKQVTGVRFTVVRPDMSKEGTQ